MSTEHAPSYDRDQTGRSGAPYVDTAMDPTDPSPNPGGPSPMPGGPNPIPEPAVSYPDVRPVPIDDPSPNPGGPDPEPGGPNPAE